MRKLRGFLNEVRGRRGRNELRLSRVLVMALLMCLLQPCNAFAEYVFDREWGMLGGRQNVMWPYGVVVDSSGSVYVADPGSGRILKFTANGAYLTQWGTYGTGNGQFFYPAGVAVDSTGNVYVADVGNDRIQKFTADGKYLTQWGTRGTGNGQFDHPYWVAVDSTGSVYVVDTENDRIQKFTSSGTYLTQWGTRGGGNGQFVNPYGVTVDSSGNVYVADWGNVRIQKFTEDGAYLTQWGGYGTGNGQFSNPHSVAVDSSGNVYVVDMYNDRIQKFTASGTYLTQWGSSGSGDVQFLNPFGVAVDSSGNVYVTDWDNYRIQKFSASGTYLTQWGLYGSGDVESWNPYGVANSYLSDVYVADRDNCRIRKFAADGTYLTQWGSRGSGNGQFDSPQGVAVDSSGSVYVADSGNDRIQKFTADGAYVTHWGSRGSGNGQFLGPRAVAVDSSGNVYVADFDNHRVQKFTAGGTYLTQWGGFGDANGQFRWPAGVAVDSSGIVCVVDGHGLIQKFTANGTYLAQFATLGALPGGVAVDSSGNVYVVDTGNFSITKFTASGTYVTQWGSYGSANGQFNVPNGVAVDTSENVYVADTGNHRIQKFLYVAPTLPTPPALGTLMPSVVTSIENAAQSFSAVYSDANGYSDLKHVYLKVGSLVNGMVVIYSRTTNQAYLVDDAGTDYVGSCTPGVAEVLANTQGMLDCRLTTVSGAGNDLTVNWNITPKAGFAGTKNLYMFARDTADSTVGWEDKGGWTITSSGVVAPSLGALTPSVVASGENVAQSFSTVYSDGDGFRDLKHVYLKVGSLTDGIVAVYSRTTNQLYLVNDAGTEYVGSCTPGAAEILTNTQGTLDCGLTTVSGTGNDLTVNWNITPKAGYAGTKSLYLFARDTADSTAGWEDKGGWTITSSGVVTPALGTLTPSVVASATNVGQSFSAVYSDGDGCRDLKHVYLKVGSLMNGIVAIYSRTTNQAYLVNDAGTDYVGSCTPGVSEVLANTQGTLDCGLTTVSGTGNNLTVNWNITPKAGFAGTKSLYLFARDNADSTAGWEDKGDWGITP